MYTKITFENIATIEPGTEVVKYPLFGDPTEMVDDTLENQISNFIVATIDSTTSTVELHVPQFGGEIALMPVAIHSVHKSFSQLIEENVWWIKQP